MKFTAIFTLVAAATTAVYAAESCSPLYGQCGGHYWGGPTCCEYGSKCQIQNEWYYQCVYDPNPEPTTTIAPNSTISDAPKYPCANWYGQCGGKGWAGTNCCAIGSECTNFGEYYSQCVPIPNTSSCQSLYGQCGGNGYTGPTCCQVGAECVRDSEWYSQCRAIPGVLYGVGPGNNGEGVVTSSTTSFAASSTSTKFTLSSKFTHFQNSTTLAAPTS